MRGRCHHGRWGCYRRDSDVVDPRVVSDCRFGKSRRQRYERYSGVTVVFSVVGDVVPMHELTNFREWLHSHEYVVEVYRLLRPFQGERVRVDVTVCSNVDWMVVLVLVTCGDSTIWFAD